MQDRALPVIRCYYALQGSASAAAVFVDISAATLHQHGRGGVPGCSVALQLHRSFETKRAADNGHLRPHSLYAKLSALDCSEERRPESRMQTAMMDYWKLENVYLLLTVMLMVHFAEITLIM